MLLSRDWIFLLLGLLSAALSFALPLFPFPGILHWHDSQRIGEILILFFVVIGLTIYLARSSTLFPAIPSAYFRVVVLVAVVGLVSAALSRQPMWAIVEWSLFLGLMAMAYAIVLVRHATPRLLDYGLLGLLALTCAALIARDFATYAGLLVRGDRELHIHQIFTGFSNPRFFGQFITITLPVLAVVAMSAGRLRRYAVPALVVLTLWWTLAIASGTRGTWLGLAVAILIMAWLGANARRWLVIQLATAVLGLVLYWWWFTLIPRQWATELSGHAITRLTTSLSGREIIWQQALDLIRDHPFLGAGPMHFADVINNNATHPHQSVLQWAAEWGLPSTILLLLLITMAAMTVFRRIRLESSIRSDSSAFRVALAASLVASLTQSLVDGVLVMPNTQLWLAIIAGWCLALHSPWSSTPSRKKRFQRLSWVVILWAAIGVLGLRVVSDAPQLNSRMAEFVFSGISGHLQPRFWSQGIIGMDRWPARDSGRQNPVGQWPKEGS